MDVGRHPNITLWTSSEVVKLTGKAGDFNVDVLRHARYVDIDECTACGDCAAVCPITVPDEFDLGLGERKAIYQPFPQAVPSAYLRSESDCLSKAKRPCGLCAKACKKDCIDYEEKDRVETINVGSRRV